MPKKKTPPQDIDELLNFLDKVIPDFKHSNNYINIAFNSRIIKKLIEEKQDLDKKSENGHTLFSAAIHFKKLKICKLLVENGVKPKCIVESVDNDDVQLVSFLVNKDSSLINSVSPGNSPLSERTTPLINAVKRGNKRMCRLLLRGGANANAAFNDISPLFLAVFNSNKYLCWLLISHGAEVNTIHKDKPLLSWACEKKCVEICTMLIEAGADVNKKTSIGNTPLVSLFNQQIWYTKQTYDIFKLLMKSNAKINEGHNKNFDSPLLSFVVPIYRYKRGIHEELLKKGADVNYMNPSGETPLSRAIRLGNTHLVRLFEMSGANTKTDNVLNALSFLNTDIFDGFIIERNIVEKSERRDTKILLSILCARHFCEDHVFYKDYLPLDVLKVILNLAMVPFRLPSMKFLTKVKGFLEETKMFIRGK